MKKICLFLLILLFLSPPSFAQDNVNLNLANPFAKGNYSFPMMNNLKYHSYNQYNDQDVRLGEWSELDYALVFTWFAMNHFGLGLDLKGSSERYEYSNLTRNKNFSIGAHLTWGTSLTNNLGVYISPEFSLNWQKDIFKPQTGNEVRQEQDGFGYGVTAGFPLRLCNRTSFLTPKISWFHDKLNFDNGAEIRSGLRFSVGLQTYLAPNQFACGMGNSFNYHDLYDQGSWYLECGTKGSYSFYDTEFDDDLPAPNQEYHYSGAMVRLNGTYNVIDNLGIGWGLNYRNRMNEVEGTDYRTETKSFMTGPSITYNLPFKNFAHNFYLEGGYRFGNETLEVDNGMSVNKDKWKNTRIQAGLGYNYPIGVNVSLPISAQYKIEKQEDTDTNQKYTNRGWGFSTGVRFTF